MSITIKLNTRVERGDGVWTTLRFDPHGGYVPGLGPLGVYYAEHGAPYFPAGLEAPVLTHHRDRGRVERAMRAWLKTADSQ